MASIRHVAREPLLQFLVLGALIWYGVEQWSVADDRYTIRIGGSERQRIVRNYFLQFGRVPTPQQEQALVERHIRDEIYWREGLALGLDRDDEIVRRRVVQKYEFLRTDMAVADVPEDKSLEHWFERHGARYLAPGKISFEHLYFSPDRGETAARQRAAEALRKLRGSRGDLSHLGDAFPGPSAVNASTLSEIIRLFGESEFSERLFRSVPGQWQGPYRSGYGWHLVRIAACSPATLPRFNDVRERVLADYQNEQQHLEEKRSLERLRSKYTIRYIGASK